MFPRKSPKAFREPVSQDGQFGLFERPKVDFGRLAKQCPNLDVNLPQKKIGCGCGCSSGTIVRNVNAKLFSAFRSKKVHDHTEVLQHDRLPLSMLCQDLAQSQKFSHELF